MLIVYNIPGLVCCTCGLLKGRMMSPVVQLLFRADTACTLEIIAFAGVIFMVSRLQ
jgi:hypothetical protein